MSRKKQPSQKDVDRIVQALKFKPNVKGHPDTIFFQECDPNYCVKRAVEELRLITNGQTPSLEETNSLIKAGKLILMALVKLDSLHEPQDPIDELLHSSNRKDEFNND